MPCFGYINKAAKAFQGNLMLMPFNLWLKLHLNFMDFVIHKLVDDKIIGSGLKRMYPT